LHNNKKKNKQNKSKVKKINKKKDAEFKQWCADQLGLSIATTFKFDELSHRLENAIKGFIYLCVSFS
jgi:hypothetical protein